MNQNIANKIAEVLKSNLTWFYESAGYSDVAAYKDSVAQEMLTLFQSLNPAIDAGEFLTASGTRKP